MFPAPNRFSLVPFLVFAILSIPLVGLVDADETVPVAQAPIPRGAWEAPPVPGELLVKLPMDNGARLERAGMTILREIPELGLAVVQTNTDDLLAAAANVEGLPGVEWAEPNYTFQLDFVPNDPSYAEMQTPYLEKLDVASAWDVTTGRPEVIVAVLDTGVEMSHEDLVGAIWSNPGEIPDNGIDDEGNGFIDDVNGWDFASNNNVPDDDHGHGTHVAGIIAARTDNGKGIAGLAGQATIMPVDVFTGGVGTYEDLIRAIIYATDNGADVINMSLGASSYSLGEEMAVNYAFSNGVVLAAAAGNSGSERLHYPAAHEIVIAVASTTADDVLSSFSTRGEWIDVAAPGSSIYSTFRGNSYATRSGTSMATPHVSGLAALVLSQNGALTPTQVQDLIKANVSDLGPTGSDIYFGAGRINAGRVLGITAPGEAPPVPVPGPGLDIDLPGCRELVKNGGFEDGLSAWQTEGAVEVDGTIHYSGQASLHFLGGVGSRGVVSQTVTIPAAAVGVVKFVYRINPEDMGTGTAPDWPFDDWFTVEWRTPGGQPVGELLRTGNTADTVHAGLAWDRYLYRIEAADFTVLSAREPVSLVFSAQNDGDDLKTDIWVDSVQFCVARRIYLPQAWWGDE